MSEEKFILTCPVCGKVEGFLPADQDQDESEAELAGGEDYIEEQVFDVQGVPVTRLRCPRCGGWVPADQAEPE